MAVLEVVPKILKGRETVFITIKCRIDRKEVLATALETELMTLLLNIHRVISIHRALC